VTAVIASLYVTSLLCELAGAALVVAEARTAGQALREYVARGTQTGVGTSVGQVTHANEAIAAALGNQAKRRAAIALLFAGILAGSVANLMTLPQQ
jgi:hypothetical protein